MKFPDLDSELNQVRASNSVLQSRLERVFANCEQQKLEQVALTDKIMEMLQFSQTGERQIANSEVTRARRSHETRIDSSLCLLQLHSDITRKRARVSFVKGNVDIKREMLRRVNSELRIKSCGQSCVVIGEGSFTEWLCKHHKVSTMNMEKLIKNLRDLTDGIAASKFALSNSRSELARSRVMNEWNKEMDDFLGIDVTISMTG
jgi:hypothetical protein